MPTCGAARSSRRTLLGAGDCMSDMVDFSDDEYEVIATRKYTNDGDLAGVTIDVLHKPSGRRKPTAFISAQDLNRTVDDVIRDYKAELKKDPEDDH